MFYRSSRSALAVALLAVVVLLPAVAAIDGIVQGHRYCAEHNTLEHVDDDAADPGAAARPISDQPLVLDGEDASEHDACPLATVGVRQVDATVAPPRAATTAQRDTTCRPPVLAVVSPPVSVLSAAPKQSPPGPLA